MLCRPHQPLDVLDPRGKKPGHEISENILVGVSKLGNPKPDPDVVLALFPALDLVVVEQVVPAGRLPERRPVPVCPERWVHRLAKVGAASALEELCRRVTQPASKAQPLPPWQDHGPVRPTRALALQSPLGVVPNDRNEADRLLRVAMLEHEGFGLG